MSINNHGRGYEMTMKELTSYIALSEGKKKSVQIGDVREVLAILSDMLYEDPRIVSTLFMNGQSRAKKRK